MKIFLVVPLLAAACLAAPTVNTAVDEGVRRDLVFRCLPSAELRILKDGTQPVYICRAEGRVLALAFDTLVPRDDKELHVVLEPETLIKLGEALVPREKRTLIGSGSGAGSAAQAGSASIGFNPFPSLLGPSPIFSGSLSHAQAQSGAISGTGLLG